MTIKYADDVLRERRERQRKESKKIFVENMNNSFDKSFPSVRRKIKIFKFLIKFFGLLFLIILTLLSIFLIKLLVGLVF